MFTSNDYKDYFEEIALTERAMVYQVEEVVSGLGDGELRGSLKKIVADEIRHYAAMMNVLESLLLKSDVEKRAFIREHSLGKVTMKCVSTGREFSAYCVNVSEKGLCIEFVEPLSSKDQDEYELQVDFYDRSGSLRRVGVVKWDVKINPAFYMAGVHYRAGIEFVP